jgi:hypothetical protein
MQSLNVYSVQTKLKEFLGYQWHLISSRMKADIYIALIECNISLDEIRGMDCGENIIIHTVRGLFVFNAVGVLGYSDN